MRLFLKLNLLIFYNIAKQVQHLFGVISIEGPLARQLALWDLPRSPIPKRWYLFVQTSDNYVDSLEAAFLFSGKCQFKGHRVQSDDFESQKDLHQEVGGDRSSSVCRDCCWCSEESLVSYNFVGYGHFASTRSQNFCPPFFNIYSNKETQTAYFLWFVIQIIYFYVHFNQLIVDV